MAIYDLEERLLLDTQIKPGRSWIHAEGCQELSASAL